ncbi:hypothetical protein HELRODRAFT_185204 [Helobdella robusta]|uniref:Inosine/uridine-preferring nucleoside hydrolase domain-containing protein n=1 Tax=Helobdella robusta TaxID=6412 RepID=T1FMI2_HELRO|nr:hypothetical protein HELRODRAFT_185204 [Helobdella robusta]ESN91808.1 hypothetical protein HELRODRAFT_185204 [Helobdella robusta]
MVWQKGVFILATALFIAYEGTYAHPLAPKRKVIVDCDPGGDDAHALIMLLRQTAKIDVIGITVTFGNVYLEQVARNAIRILKLNDRLNIPVYLGSKHGLVNRNLSTDYYFGPDGFGNFSDDTVLSDYTPYLSNTENATAAMRRMVAQNPANEVTLVAIGPLTNLANVLKEDPEFGTKLQETIIMGGNYKSVGNISPYAEFNFFEDPEGANEVMTKWKGTIYLITWELSLSTSIPWDWYDHHITGKDSKYSKFLENVGRLMRGNAAKQNITVFNPCDQVAAAFLLHRSIMNNATLVDCYVELTNQTRLGENVVDMNSSKPNKNIHLITHLNMPLLKKILSDSTDP